MQKQVYPNIDAESSLPFYIVGIGVDAWQFPVERHEGYEYPQLFVTREGEGEIYFEGRHVRLVPNSVFYLPPHCPHEYQAVTKSWYVDWICFDGTHVMDILEQWQVNRFLYFLNCGAERIHELMEKAYYMIKSDKQYGNYYASALLYDILLEYKKLADNKFPYISKESPDAVARVLRFMEDNYQKPLKLADIAQTAEMSEQHICRLFKKNIKTSPIDYLNQIRINQAKELLSYSDSTIAEIAANVGFSDSSYFSVVFKKYEGISPAEYKKI